MSTILIFGASGAIGRFLLPRLSPAHSIAPVSRMRHEPGWVQGDINDPAIAWPAADVAISLGPLDAFAEWLRRQHRRPRRVIALSSMSVVSKCESADPAERELAARLGTAEQYLLRLGNERGIAVTLFRPTLIYGAGVDRSLAPIARFARRWRVLPVPRGATGLRQPVHARDLAAACVAALDAPATHGRTYETGGGEQLTFAAMIERLHLCVDGPVLRLPIPHALLNLMRGRFPAIGRLRTPLVADNRAAARDFGYAPGPFDARGVLPP